MDAIADTLEAVESAVGLTLEALLEVTSVDEALAEANTAVLFTGANFGISFDLILLVSLVPMNTLDAHILGTISLAEKVLFKACLR